MNSEQVKDAYIESAEDRLIDRARAKLLPFTLYTFPEYEVNWHHRAMAEVLDRFARKEIRFLMIFAPPRHGKSELVSRRLPPFLNGLYPDDEIMAASYNSALASDMTVDAERIMDTPEYRKVFPDSSITPEGSKTSYSRNSEEYELIGRKGSYRGQGVGGAFVGRGANWIIVDDPIKGRESADSPAYRDHLWKFYTGSLRNRLEKNGSILLTLTRWHEDDLAGRLLQFAKDDPNADQWEVFKFPALKEDESNPVDKREIGEPLWPNKYDVKDLLALKAAGSRDWNALFQQRPSAEEGNIINRNWWKYYVEPPGRFDEVIQSWDLAFTAKAKSDWVVGQVWGRVGSSKYLLDQVRGRLGFNNSVQAIIQLSNKWTAARLKLIENKANGPAVEDVLRKTVPGIVLVEPMGDKVARVNAVAPTIEAGNVYLPQNAPWIHDFVSECSDFPNGTNDDQVDSMTQALIRLETRKAMFAPISGHGMM